MNTLAQSVEFAMEDFQSPPSGWSWNDVALVFAYAAIAVVGLWLMASFAPDLWRRSLWLRTILGKCVTVPAAPERPRLTPRSWIILLAGVAIGYFGAHLVTNRYYQHWEGSWLYCTDKWTGHLYVFSPAIARWVDLGQPK